MTVEQSNYCIDGFILHLKWLNLHEQLVCVVFSIKIKFYIKAQNLPLNSNGVMSISNQLSLFNFNSSI